MLRGKGQTKSVLAGTGAPQKVLLAGAQLAGQKVGSPAKARPWQEYQERPQPPKAEAKTSHVAQHRRAPCPSEDWLPTYHLTPAPHTALPSLTW